jgi:hypothetical protein
MPRNPIDKGRKICKVPAEKCIHMPDEQSVRDENDGMAAAD